jgi:hypothetical protein
MCSVTSACWAPPMQKYLRATKSNTANSVSKRFLPVLVFPGISVLLRCGQTSSFLQLRLEFSHTLYWSDNPVPDIQACLESGVQVPENSGNPPTGVQVPE